MSFEKGRDLSDQEKLANALEQVAKAITTGKKKDDDTLRDVVSLQQDMLVRQMPENKQPTGVSAYSYPEGDRLRPRPPLKCEMFWVGYPLDLDTLTPPEIDVLNQLEPGEFRVRKANGNLIPFTVEAKRTMGGKIQQLWVNFPCKGDQSTDHGSMVSYCQQALGMKVPTMEEMQAELAKLRGTLATVA